MSHFRVLEHTVKCQHTRERPAGAELGHENDLRLHVKQYVPKTNDQPKVGDVTIIGAHANGFPKELYEPLWDDLYGHLQKQGRNIRSIWISDVAGQGQSGILNEALLGPESSWWDHGRDLLFLLNQFQDQMPHPIIGIGHSLSTLRRDVWPSRAAAAKKFASSKFYQIWDPRVLEKWNEYGLRDLPTEQYPGAVQSGEDGPPVTLSTTVAQEVYSYLRATYSDPRLLHDNKPLRDVHPNNIDQIPFARAECQELYRKLPKIRPSVHYLFGRTSEASTSKLREGKMTITGTGVGGSGGAAEGMVGETVLDCGHLVPMERPKECAEACASHINHELVRWNDEEQKRQVVWNSLSRRERVDINDEWKRHMKALSVEDQPDLSGATKSKL
ncbi:hypothetical protein LTR97_000287 [Elasticomyces elasticus]|uniref:AB hydrolase-1 domain-containing protein n=1 Tax=Elasticomyces elasticus TaxID=574655 RepID=A0AAN7ZWB6_9PEZI|nr:hypothetical protein LTR97_000287 [Elasticomyces elasticus]